jgi:hypothetical protein
MRCQWAWVPSGAMDFQDVVRHRRMVRQFTSDPVPPRSLDRILATERTNRASRRRPLAEMIHYGQVDLKVLT